jgi:hypothetical protein
MQRRFEAPLVGVSDISIDQVNYYELSYIGDLWVGSEPVAVGVVYDTGSDWLVIEDATCDTCEGTNYDTTSSTEYALIGTESEENNYGSASLITWDVTDDVYLD